MTKMITDIPALHAQLKDMLNCVGSILEADSVPYFLTAGTALGAVREGDLIPWDRDVDILIPLPDYAAALNALEQNLPERYRLIRAEDRRAGTAFARVALKDVEFDYLGLDLFQLGGTFKNKALRLAHLRTIRALRLAIIARASFLYPRRRTDERHMKARVLRGLGALGALLPYGLLARANRALRQLVPLENAVLANNLDAEYWRAPASGFPVAMFQRAQQAELDGRSYPCPMPVHRYLQGLFGDYSKRPPANAIQAEYDAIRTEVLPALARVPLRLEQS